MSEVFFAKVESSDPKERQSQLEKLLASSTGNMVYAKDEIVPLKLTIGDSTCVHNMDPGLVKAVVSKVTAQGAKPFLFDTSVIYKGERQIAVDHLRLVQNKKFSYSDVGAPFIVADGVLGQDGRDFEIDAKNIKKIRVPSFVGMLDSLIVLSHATGHIFSGFAGALKNVAMGMSCRPTKQVQHSSMKPSVIQDKCKACGCCIKICPVSALSMNNRKKAHVDPGVCLGCGECLCACKFDAVYVNWEEDMGVFCERMDEVADFILSKFKNKFFITFAFDITQECDCISTKNDKLVSKNIGILASGDPLALDKATADLMSDDFGFFKEHNAYEHMFDYAQKIGIGSLEYKLVMI
ncbi:MAG TPA: DUF362 domain-containing protein [Candidatus Omnitrophota bacterium]|nr:DUF362 domain-containing protein [Candidatus Omnitrophota bacterium]